MLSDVSPFLRFGAAKSLPKPPFLARQGRSDQISRLSAPSDPDTPIDAKNSSAKNGRSPRPGPGCRSAKERRIVATLPATSRTTGAASAVVENERWLRKERSMVIPCGS